MNLIIGGGLGGLAAAYYLGTQGIRVTLVEQSARVGGWLRTIHDPVTGAILETGPHTIRPQGKKGVVTLNLVASLGLSENVLGIDRNHPAATKRLILVGNKLHPLPNSFKSLFTTNPPFTKPLIFSLIKDLFTPPGKSSDESVYDFVKRRFGYEMAEFIISPMICGICAGDAHEISVKSLLPIIVDAEQSKGSVAWGMISEGFKSKPITSDYFPEMKRWSVWTMKTGIQMLTDTLYEFIQKQGAQVYLNSKVSDLTIKPGSVTCKINGKTEEFSQLVSAVSAVNLAPLLAKDHPNFAALLKETSMVSVVVVNLVFKGQQLKENAFGFLVPPKEKLNLLGVIFDSCILPQGDLTILTAMMGGRWFDKYFKETRCNGDLKDIVMKHVRSILGIKVEPESYHVSIHRDCIPQYTLGHTQRVSSLNRYIEINCLPISLVGSSYHGVGVNDVVMSAKNAAELLIE